MRAKLAKAVRETFARKLQEALPQFIPVESQRDSGNRLYKWGVAPDVNFYVYLQLSAKSHEDSFTIELGCSRREYPFDHGARDPNHEKDGAVRFRLPQLYREEWRPKTGREPWWWIGPQKSAKESIARTMERVKSGKLPEKDEGLMPIEQALPLVEPQVQDAIERLKRYGMPFFQKFAKQHAIQT